MTETRAKLDEVWTGLKTPRLAADDIAVRLTLWMRGAGMTGDEPRAFQRDGEWFISVDGIAFDAAHGFVDGTGLYGYEGYGPCGPVHNEDWSGVHLEVEDSATIGVYRK